MNIYANDFSLFDFDYTDSIIHPYSHRRVSASLDSGIVFHNYGYDYDEHTVHAKANYGRVSTNRAVRNRSPPKHRHDGTSPLPLGMDWSPPPLKREGQDSLRPDDSHKGWSYCAMILSWVLLPKSIGSDPVVFYRVRVSIKSPEGVTTTRGILRRFNDFLKLFSELKKTFPVKDLPPAPSKRLLRIKSQTLLEERRCSLEDWMEKLLSDIDISRSVEIAMFLELEAAVRSSFEEVNQQSSDAKSSSNGAFQSFPLQASSDVSVIAGGSSITSDHGDETSEISELGTPRQDGDFTDLGMDKSTSEQDLVDPNFGMFNGNFIRESLQRFSKHKMPTEIEGSSIARDRVREDTSDAKPLRLDGTEFFPELDYYKQEGHVRRVSTESLGSDLSSVRASEVFNSVVANVVGDGDVSGGSELPRNVDSFNKSDVEVPVHSLVAFASDERLKLNRVLISLQRRLATARTDAENLIARLNQEVAVRQFLSTKVRDLEVELETTRQNCKENMEQTVLTEKERFTQMQWDMEELRRKCLDLEVKLKSEQEEKEFAESTKILIIHENKKLLQELDLSREQLEKLQKHHEDLEVKSKTDVKMLVKEVKSLRNSHSELKQEFGQLMKEKLEVEKSLQKERQRAEKANAANVKLLHECGILCHRLQECSVNFLVEEEDKLIVDTSSPSDALDLLTTSDNRMGLLLAEAQLLAEDIEKSVEEVDESHKVIVNGGGGGDKRKADDELRKMVTDILVDNARLRKQVNSVIRCALSTYAKAERDEDDEDVPLRKTVLSKFLES